MNAEDSEAVVKTSSSCAPMKVRSLIWYRRSNRCYRVTRILPTTCVYERKYAWYLFLCKCKNRKKRQNTCIRVVSRAGLFGSGSGRVRAWTSRLVYNSGMQLTNMRISARKYAWSIKTALAVQIFEAEITRVSKQQRHNLHNPKKMKSHEYKFRNVIYRGVSIYTYTIVNHTQNNIGFFYIFYLFSLFETKFRQYRKTNHSL